MMDSNTLFLFDEIVFFDRWAAQATSVDDEALRWNKVFGGEQFLSSRLLISPVRQTDSRLISLLLHEACTRMLPIGSTGLIR